MELTTIYIWYPWHRMYGAENSRKISKEQHHQEKEEKKKHESEQSKEANDCRSRLVLTVWT